jgi:His-Xaa-Ser system protein HxsD
MTDTSISLFAGNDVATLDLDEELYSTDAIFRVAYDFTDRYFVFLSRPAAGVILVLLAPQNPSTPFRDVAGIFANALIDQRLRERIERDTSLIRDLLVAQAFSEADLLDRSGTEADYGDDPRGIGRWQ